MKKIIKLKSRYSSNYLEVVDHDEETITYQLKTELGCYRIINDEKKKIIAIDPPGGPLMSIGDNSIIKCYSVDSIKIKNKDPFIKFKKV